jgi:PiT family inorganic phosphate transporter
MPLATHFNYLYVVAICAIAFIFDFINGFHDSANSIATVVSTRVLRPLYAVGWAAFFNFVAAFGFGVRVATAMGKGIVHESAINNEVILAALMGAIVWDLITWYLGVPTSSSHALIGGMAGAALVRFGPASLMAMGLLKITAFIVISPLLGIVLGYSLRTLVNSIFWHSSPQATASLFRRLQLLSAALYSLGHGTNDAQKTMGIVAILLYTNGYLGPRFFVPTWVILTAHAAIALGTAAGGWRIVKTMGMRITKLQPVDGFCAETSAAASLFGTACAGIPVSTTHTITGAIVGVGSTRRLTAVRWGVTVGVVWAWVLTIPGAALVGAVCRLLLMALH